MIKNYGLFWERKHVHWGAGRNRGHLKGVPATAITSAPVDFRNQQGIYALYDESFNLVYVGQAGSKKNRLFDRLKQHQTDRLAQRWSRFSWFGVRRVLASLKLSAENTAFHPTLSEVLDHFESIALAISEPPHNKQNSRFGSDVHQYIQHYDKENLGPPQEEMIKQIYLRINGGQG